MFQQFQLGILLIHSFDAFFAEFKQLGEDMGFKWVESRKEFAHSAALIVLTPEGRVSRYIYGVDFPPSHVTLSR